VARYQHVIWQGTFLISPPTTTTTTAALTTIALIDITIAYVLVLRAWQRMACTWQDATLTEADAITAAPAAPPRRLITLARTQTNVAVSSWGPLAIFAGGTLKRGLPKSDAIDIWNSTSGKCKANLACVAQVVCGAVAAWPRGRARGMTLRGQ
jgi:hypothetical protein